MPGDERAPRGQPGHRLGDGAVEAQRVAGQVVQVRRVGRRAALEGVDVVLAHERQHHEHDVLRAVAVVVLGSCGGGQRAPAPKQARARGADAAAAQQRAPRA